MAARRDVVGRLLNYDLPPSPPPRPSLRIQPLVDAQAAGVGRSRYGMPPPGPGAGAANQVANQNKQYNRMNPVLQPISNNQLNQANNVDREAERLREAYRMLQQRPQSPRAVLEPLQPSQLGNAALGRAREGQGPSGGESNSASSKQVEFLSNQVALSMSKVGNRVDSVEDVIASLGRVVVQCQKDIQTLDMNKRVLEQELRDSRAMLDQQDVNRAEAGKDVVRLGHKLDTLISELGSQKLEMQTFKSQLLGDSALLEKLREATGDTVQVTAEQIATLNRRVGDVMRDMQLLTQSFTEEVKERKALEQESRIQYTNAEAGLVQTESNILRRVLAVVEAQSKEIMRKVSEGESLAEERHNVHKSALEEQWRLIIDKESLEKKTIIERMLILEKALREEHESRIYSERMVRDFIEQKNEEIGKALEMSKAGDRENTEYLRKQLVGAFQRMEGLLTETDQATSAKVKELESIVKLEVQARMKSIRKLNGIWHESFSEVNKMDSRIINIENVIQEIENSVTDLVVGDVANNLLETSIQELHVEDMARQVSEMDDKVVKVKELILQEFDGMKDLQEVSKRRQDTSIEQMRSELNLKNTTITLRFDELKAQVDELRAYDPSKDISEIHKQKVRLDEMQTKIDEISEKTGISVQNVEDMDDKVEQMGSKLLEVRKLLLSEFDSLKDLQDASKKRQDNSIEQFRSEYNLNKVTNQLRIDELKAKITEMGEKLENIESDIVYGPKPQEVENEEPEQEKNPEEEYEEDELPPGEEEQAEEEEEEEVQASSEALEAEQKEKEQDARLEEFMEKSKEELEIIKGKRQESESQLKEEVAQEEGLQKVAEAKESEEYEGQDAGLEALVRMREKRQQESQQRESQQQESQQQESQQQESQQQESQLEEEEPPSA